MAPLPADAPDDIPAYVGKRPECQIGFEDVKPSVCAYGDTTSDRVVVLVGKLEDRPVAGRVRGHREARGLEDRSDLQVGL